MTYALAILLHGAEGVGSPISMLTDKNRLRNPIPEFHDTMLPIPNMVTKANSKDAVAKVVAVKVEPECKYDAVTLVNHSQNGWRRTSPAYLANLLLLSTFFALALRRS